MEDKFQQLIREVEEQMAKQRQQKKEQLPKDLSHFFLDSSQTQLDPYRCGFNEEELQSAIKVLRSLAEYDRKELIRHQKLGQLRQSLRQFLGSGEEKKKIKESGLKMYNQVNAITDICCEMRIKKNNEKVLVNNQIQSQMNQQQLMLMNSQNDQQLMVQNQNQQRTDAEYDFERRKKREAVQSYDRPSYFDIQTMYTAEFVDYLENLRNNSQQQQEESKQSNDNSNNAEQDEIFQIDTSSDNNLTNRQVEQVVITEEMKEQLRETIRVDRKCYTCQRQFSKLHFFYDQMCRDCGNLNYQKRIQTCDLRGKVALVTGGRIKIGYQIVLMLLRNGAHTIVTTRFPKDCALKLISEADFDQWADRLEIYGLDFKYIPSIYEFCEFVKRKYTRLDILINNAAQTIRREPALNEPFVKQEFEVDISQNDQLRRILPNDFRNQRVDQLLISQGLMPKNYQQVTSASSIPLSSSENSDQVEQEELKESEQNERDQIILNTQVSKSALVSRLKLDQNDDFEAMSTVVDVNNELVDFRNKNSWVRELDEVSLSEFMEVYLINATAPFIICSQLKVLMEKSPERPRFIVNVSAMEGQFYKRFKNSTHPHTNMAKAALNMMTRSCGCYYAISDIYMNAADTGWVTDENPRAFEKGFTVPLDEIDGAMRVLDCVFVGFNHGILQHSRFYKDYKECYW